MDKKQYQIQVAKRIMESAGYKVTKKSSRRIKESIDFEVEFKDPDATCDNFLRAARDFRGDIKLATPISTENDFFQTTDDVIRTMFDQAGNHYYSFKERDDVVDGVERVLRGWEEGMYYEEEDFISLYNSALEKLDYVFGTDFSTQYHVELEEDY